MADLWSGAIKPEQTEQVWRQAHQWLGLDQHHLEEVLVATAKSLPAMSQLFEVTAFQPDELTRIIERARQVLVEISFETAQKAQEQEARVLSLSFENDHLRLQSQEDALTGLGNRASFDWALENEFEEADRSGSPLSIVVCDIDHFKALNDTYGHLCGDKILKQIASLLLKGTRQRSDIVTRYGGEEFVLILPGTDFNAAHAVAERIRQQLAEAEFETGQIRLRVTASFGLATHTKQQPFKRPSDLFRVADESLYSAKRLGRNRVVGYPSRNSQISAA